ncbi:MAG TPA: helix-turn-helix domain-containing protein [Alcanivorax sp.]|nr:helix-turn-helix domain-containing protein [Alcanivorax sp.]
MHSYLTPKEVSDRYKGSITVKTLANWRTKKSGPKWTKIGGKILYRLDHILKWEETRTASSHLLCLVAALVSSLLVFDIA